MFDFKQALMVGQLFDDVQQGMGIFSDCQIALDLDATQVPFKKKQLLRQQVTSNGGVISYILTKKTSYLVASNGPKTADSYKGRTAKKQGVPIISMGFIERCLEEGRLVDHEDFLLVGKTSSMQFSSGKIIAAKTQQEPKKKAKVLSFNINKIKVWPWGSVDTPAYPEDKYEIAKSVLLQKRDTRSKDRLFYHLELHVVPDDVFNLSRNTKDSGPACDHPFRVFTHRGVLDHLMDEDSGAREVRYCNSSEEALETYSFLYHQQQQHGMSRGKKAASRWIGSPKYRQTQLSIGEEEDEMSLEVASLVASLWKETLGELEDILAVDIKTLTSEKVSKAESILLQIRKALDGGGDDTDKFEASIETLSQEFYSQIPHKSEHKKDIKTKSVIAKKQDLCQLIKDVVSVSETTNWSQRSSVESKYRALRCHISCLPDNHPHYYDVKNFIISTQGKKLAEILRVFAVTRPLELTSFDAKLHNSRLLFHASRPANFVGILSRGLILPKVVVDDFGGERTDAGMLGSGIYFADNFSTSAKYSHISHTRGTRLMTINQVALGICYETTSYHKDFTEPPDGFHSVHGVRNDGSNRSDFKDDEYAVYSTEQQRLRYVVEFTLPGDKPKLTTGQALAGEANVCSEEDSDGQASDTEGDKSSAIDLSDVQSIEDPLNKVQPGLLSSSDQPIPLKAVHARAKLLDLAAQVVVLQVYANDSDFPIEAKYVFPLDEQAAVCGFEAFINDKHIVGEVKEKETAHKEYKEAISKGHGAYLMDEEKPDVFTVSVGNLPPKTTVVIKITYVAELAVDGDKILFGLPGSVAPWRKDEALAQETQADVTTVKVKDTDRSLSVHVAIEMPYEIRSLESPTHPIKRKQTASKATVCLADDCLGLDDGFQLLIGLAEIHVPRMWVERHPEDSDSQACMLTFYPEFEAEQTDQSEVVLLLDLSNSMRGGSSLQEAKKVALLALHHLPKDWRFNVVVFGTDFEELFPQSQAKTPDTVKSATNFLQGLSAAMGNTDVWHPLRTYFMLKSGQLCNIFIISDGHVSNEDATLEAVRRNCRHTRVFTLGVSATANKYLLRAVATAGAGAFEFFDSKTKSKWEGKIKSQLSKAAQPVLSSVSVDWCQFDDDAPAPIQAPNNITSLFSGSRQVVYGFVPHCTQATLRANNEGREVSTMVSTHELSITQGKILHQLTARNIIRDWEEGALAADRTRHEARKAEQKSYIIELSKKYSIVTQFTSFVAVEVRDKSEEGKVKTGVDVNDLLKKEEVDSLPYLGWQQDKAQDAAVPTTLEEQAGIAELLDQAEREVSFSVLRTERLYQQILKKLNDSRDKYKKDPVLQRVVRQMQDFCVNVKHEDFSDWMDTMTDDIDVSELFEDTPVLAFVGDAFYSSPEEEDWINMTLECVAPEIPESPSYVPTSPSFMGASDPFARIGYMSDDDEEYLEPSAEESYDLDEDKYENDESESSEEEMERDLFLLEEEKQALPFPSSCRKNIGGGGELFRKKESKHASVAGEDKPMLKKKPDKEEQKLESDRRQQQTQQQEHATVNLLPGLSFKAVEHSLEPATYRRLSSPPSSRRAKGISEQAITPSTPAAGYSSLDSAWGGQPRGLPGMMGEFLGDTESADYLVRSQVAGGFSFGAAASAAATPSFGSAGPQAVGDKATSSDVTPRAEAASGFSFGATTSTTSFGGFGSAQPPSLADESSFADFTPRAVAAAGFSFEASAPAAPSMTFGSFQPPPTAAIPTATSAPARPGFAASGMFGQAAPVAASLPRLPLDTGVMIGITPPLPINAQQAVPPPLPLRRAVPELQLASDKVCPKILPLPTLSVSVLEPEAQFVASFTCTSTQPCEMKRASKRRAGKKPEAKKVSPLHGRRAQDSKESPEPATGLKVARSTMGTVKSAVISEEGVALGKRPGPIQQRRSLQKDTARAKMDEPCEREAPAKLWATKKKKKGYMLPTYSISLESGKAEDYISEEVGLSFEDASVLTEMADGQDEMETSAAFDWQIVQRRTEKKRGREASAAVGKGRPCDDELPPAVPPSQMARDHDAMDDQISEAISAPLGFEARESSGFRKHPGTYRLATIMRLLKSQNEDGCWDLFAGIQVFVGVRLKPVRNLLKEAGLNSLGEEVALKIERLVATYLVILYLNCFLEGPRTPTIGPQEREMITQSVLKAERFVSQVESEHPSLARRLELGSSWDEVCRDIFK
ncbi:poly [ADP-ribose] polymerase 4-like isoform X2 [Acanthaster planci]|uniref:Poly [ADP-ribose] polymerase n=1 Tax=Acanthaster planci TaxID=133434 RepID=A0A8B7ZBU1_ACAPL|nr:poly [ADP-ribose] polymerase 4-like isoform X2 [Acanthaster planci]